MSDPTKAGFDLRYPEFSAVSADLIEARLSDSIAETSATIFGTLYDRAVYALTAHALTVDARSDPGALAHGPISSKSIGDVSISYSNGSAHSASDGALMSTRYGAEYLRLRNKRVSGFLVV